MVYSIMASLQVPSGMITQVRFLYEFELKKVNERYIRQALQKMNHSDSSSKKPEVTTHCQINNN